jgi:hypothetical protein
MDRALVATHPLELAVKAENPSANTNHSLQRQGVVADRIEQAGNLSFSKRKSQCNFFCFMHPIDGYTAIMTRPHV